ncbi:unannotated protein [freshwater metagenome]|uniref:Unannotated protein n=1 Tax=freshwater metagenome TaxID=449393 RepID=A0A6J6U6C6_9ZZZZ
MCDVQQSWPAAFHTLLLLTPDQTAVVEGRQQGLSCASGRHHQVAPSPEHFTLAIEVLEHLLLKGQWLDVVGKDLVDIQRSLHGPTPRES